ncbi:uncharacterized protein LOC141708970 [Apium graveolens]|uniref:uncharacterized protein LOC141708970 n=1 Tax=Apium graveolens TaxID=4045 RepID=UPI003D7BA60A
MSEIDDLTRVETVCQKHDINKQKDLIVRGDDAFAVLYSDVDSDITAAIQKAELAANEERRASVSAEICCTKTRLLEQVPKLQELALKKVKGLSPQEFAARNDLALALTDRINAIPDGTPAVPKQTTGGWAFSATTRADFQFDSDGNFDNEHIQQTEESNQFRQEDEMRKMKLTSLSEGKGFYVPPCQILDICGFRVLFDCPLDLSALSIFSPVGVDEEEFRAAFCDDSRDSECSERKRQKVEKPLDASHLIHSEPYYKTINDFHLWDASFIDIVVISSYTGMLGLPFLTRKQGFSAKIYATEATARLGKLLMEDLVAMHAEFRQLYGPEDSGSTQWMKWEELDMLPSVIKDIVIGKDGTELGSWMPLYSAADVMDCMEKVQTLKYAEEACYNGILLIKASSSGLEIGTCNWTIISPKGTVSYLSSSCFVSSTSMDFDCHALQGSDMIIYSDFNTWKAGNNVDDYVSYSAPSTCELSDFSNSENWKIRAESLLKLDDGAEEEEKLGFLCSCSIDSLEAGGSVIIPIGRLGIILQLLEQIADSLEASNIKAPIFVISSVADELLAYTNIIPEWLCKQRQEKMYAGNSLFGHVDLLKDKRLQLFPTLHSLELLNSWEEPCVVFCPHWSMRLGPAVHLLRRCCGDPNSLLIVEDAEYTDLALLPFKPMTIKVLQCSFLSGIKLQKFEPLLNILQPKVLMIPENSRQYIPPTFNTSMSLKYFSGKETSWIPELKTTSELQIATDLTLQFQWKKLNNKETSIARMNGQLLSEHGKQRLIFQKDQEASSHAKSLMHWGKLDRKKLLASLQKMGINGFVEQENIDTESENPAIIHISEPGKALIEMKGTNIVISTDDEDLASLIHKVICSNLDCI